MNQKDSNFNQALWLGVGQLCTFLITFLTAPIMARYFDKVEYGTYKQILYVYGSLQALFTMGLPSVFAYFIPKLNKGQQLQLINKLTLLFLGLGAVFSIILFLCADIIADLLRNPELSIGIRIFSPFPLFTLPTMGVEGIYTAIRKTKEIAIYQVLSKIMVFICIVLPVVILKTGYREAVIGWGVASFLIFLMAMYMKKAPYKRVAPDVIPNMYKDIFSYSLPLIGAFIAGLFCNSADQFFVSRYYGTQAFAEFSNGCLAIPFVGMIAGSVKGVLFPLFSKAASEANLNNAITSYNNAVMKTSTIIIPMLYFCVFYAEEIMTFIFGGQYSASKDYFRMYILRDFSEIIPYFAVLMALGYSKLYMNMHIVGAFFIWILDFVIVKVFLFPAFYIVLISSLFQISCRIISIYYIYTKINVSFFTKPMFMHVFKISLHCVVTLSLLMLLKYFISPCDKIFINLIVSGVFYYFLLICTERLVNIRYMETLEMYISKIYNKKS